jgi:ABC-2 type transport system permease protein
MKLVALHARTQLVELARYPAFLVPTLLFPSMFFLFFVVPRADASDATPLMASYAGFAVLAIAFFQFGVGVAADRASPWESYLRTLPAAPAVRFAARTLAALLFAAAAATVVLTVALLSTPASLPAQRWPLLAATLLLGAIPFALLGIAIGYWTSPRGALPIANVLYLGLSYLGGLWTTSDHLPRAIRALSPVLPTRQWADALRAATRGDVAVQAWAWLAVSGVVFGALASWGYRRDEGARFS